MATANANTIQKQVLSGDVIERKMNWGKKSIGIVPDFCLDLQLVSVTFVVNSHKWVKCILKYGHKNLKDEWCFDRANGISKLHPDDKWDENIGKHIAFSKAMTQMFCLNQKRIFKNGSL